MVRSRASSHSRLLVLACLLAGACSPAGAADVLVFAAASLKPALTDVLATPEAKSIGAKASYAASSQLARQIQHGAPAALFISADKDWMDAVQQDDLLAPGTRSDLLGNALVLIAPQDSQARIDIKPGLDLAGALGADGHLALAEPNSVPAGRYAQAALRSLGVWDSVKTRIIAAANVRAALNFVVRDEVPLGIVYRSDAVSEPAVRVLGTFSGDAHPAIVYPVALIAAHDSAQARAMLKLLNSRESRVIFRRWGFDAPPASAPTPTANPHPQRVPPQQ